MIEVSHCTATMNREDPSIAKLCEAVIENARAIATLAKAVEANQKCPSYGFYFDGNADTELEPYTAQDYIDALTGSREDGDV